VATVERLQLAVGGDAMPYLVVVTPVGKQCWTMVHGGLDTYRPKGVRELGGDREHSVTNVDPVVSILGCSENSGTTVN
jgi:hypothetical protein